MHKARMQNSNAARKILDFPQPDHADERSEFENEIKARLQALTDFVETFTSSTVNLLLVEKVSAREILEELVVKEAALSWIARVATLSNEPVRERLWADIDNALTDLERIAKLLRRAQVAWPEQQYVPLYDEVVHVPYI
jgi:hypothetical protein